MLTLPIKNQWFDMIKQRIKGEEYRADTPYYASRFKKYEGQIITVRFRNGYNKLSPTIECEVKVIHKKGGKSEWGANPKEVYWTLQIKSVKDVIVDE